VNGFLDDHDDFELARRLRRAAGPTPDVYVAYDTVMSRVGFVRRRRRLATTGTTGIVLLLAAASYAINLRTSDHTIRTAEATTDPSVTTAPEIEGGSSTIVPETTTGDSGLGGGPIALDVTTTVTEPVATPAEATSPTEPTATTVAPVEVLDTQASAAPTLPPAPTAPPTTQKKPPAPKPPTTQPPATQPPATTVPETVPPTEPPATSPPDTTPPTVPATTPPTDPPATQPPATEPPVPVPLITDSSTSALGNSVTVVFQSNQLSFLHASPIEGWSADTVQPDGNPKKLRVTFTSPDGATVEVVNVTVDGSGIHFSW